MRTSELGASPQPGCYTLCARTRSKAHFHIDGELAVVRTRHAGRRRDRGSESCLSTDRASPSIYWFKLSDGSGSRPGLQLPDCMVRVGIAFVSIHQARRHTLGRSLISNLGQKRIEAGLFECFFSLDPGGNSFGTCVEPECLNSSFRVPQPQAPRLRSLPCHTRADARL